jgi:hypothetical protein
MRLSARTTILFIVLAILTGASVYAWTQGLVTSPPDLKQITEDRRKQADKQAEAEQERWRGTLTWTGWTTTGGLRLRAGLPPKVEIGVMFDVALEIESIPDHADPVHRWLCGNGRPTTTMQFLEPKGAELAHIREWTIYDLDISVPAPDTRPFFDLTQPNHTFLRPQIVIPAALKAVKPGQSSVSIRFARGEDDVEDSSKEWLGSLDAPPLSIEIGPVTFETKEVLLPKHLRLKREDPDCGAIGKSCTILVTFTKKDAERVSVTYPKGAVLMWSFNCPEPAGLPGACGGLNSGLPEAEGINGLDQWRTFDASKPVEKKYNFALTYFLPAPREDCTDDRHVTLWSRTLTAKYDPSDPPK